MIVSRFETPSRTFRQVFTGKLPFSERNTSLQVMIRIADGRRPSRPPNGKKLGLSDERWELMQSSLAHEAEGRPPIFTFVTLLEKANPDIAVFGELAQIDAYSDDGIQNLHRMFQYEDNTLLGMRETLVVIEVFDRVSLLAHHLFTPLKRS